MTSDARPKIAVVIDGPSRSKDRKRFSMYWCDGEKVRGQCFDAVLESYLEKDPNIQVCADEASAMAFLGVVLIKAEPHGSCELCGRTAELRPYGPDSKNICFQCGIKDPHLTERAMAKRFGGAKKRGTN